MYHALLWYRFTRFVLEGSRNTIIFPFMVELFWKVLPNSFNSAINGAVPNVPSSMGDILTVNGFTFCADHGWEFCHRCPYDFRSMNNEAILDELDEEIAELLDPVRIIHYSFNHFHLISRIALSCTTSTRWESSKSPRPESRHRLATSAQRMR